MMIQEFFAIRCSAVANRPLRANVASIFPFNLLCDWRKSAAIKDWLSLSIQKQLKMQKSLLWEHRMNFNVVS